MAGGDLEPISPEVEEQLRQAREAAALTGGISPGQHNPSEEAIGLSYQHIDWALDPEVIKRMSPHELVEHAVIANEQARRLHDGVVAIAKRVAKLVPENGEVPLDVEVDMIFNPDKAEYHKTPEEIVAEPEEPES
jgi:hypothetical protein